MIPRSAIAALHAGPPAHVYHYKTFTIMVWNHNLLENLGSAPGILPGEMPCITTACSRWPVSCSGEGCGKAVRLLDRARLMRTSERILFG